MSDSCPMPTKKDLELMKTFKGEIDQLKMNADNFSTEITCKLPKSQMKGGANKMLVKAIIFLITAATAGASVWLFLSAVPDSVQLYILSITNSDISMQICRTKGDYAIGAMAGQFFSKMSCSHRAKLMEEGVAKLAALFGTATGIALETKIEKWLDEMSGGSRKTKKSRKSKQTRKSKKSRKSTIK